MPAKFNVDVVGFESVRRDSSPPKDKASVVLPNANTLSATVLLP